MRVEPRPPLARADLPDGEARVSLLPKCHPRAGNVAEYSGGILRLHCRVCDAHISEFWIAREQPIVHVLRAGRTLCGLGLPVATWPERHFWVRLDDRTRANCAGCVMVAEELADLDVAGEA